jgi:hypothetical protein
MRGAGVGPRDAAVMSLAETSELLDITCPRCGKAAAVRYYGPCDWCREGLRETLGGEAKAVEAETYEPKMNVTPNAVATKD